MCTAEGSKQDACNIAIYIYIMPGTTRGNRLRNNPNWNLCSNSHYFLTPLNLNFWEMEWKK